MDANQGFADLLGTQEAIYDTIQAELILVNNIGELDTNHTIDLANTITSRAILPKTDDTYDLGSVTRKFRNIFATTTIHGRINLTDTSDQITFGNITTTTLNVPTPSTSRTYTIPDVSTDANFILSEGTQTIDGLKTFNNTITIPNAATIKFQFNGTGDGTFPTKLTCPNPTGLREVRIPDSGSTLTNDFILSRGAQTIIGPKTFSSALITNSTSNQLVLGTTNTTTITAPAPAASRVYTIPDVVNANFILSEGNQTINGIKTFSSTFDIASTTNATSKTTGALIVAGGVGISGDLYANSCVVTNASTPPTFSSTGGFYIDSFNGMQIQTTGLGTAGSFAFRNGTNNAFVILNPPEGVITGAVTFNFQRSLNDVNVAAIYNSSTAGNGIEIYGKNQVKIQIFDGVAAEDYLVIDATNKVKSVKQVLITDNTASSSQTTGALIVTGGIGCNSNCFIRGVAFQTTGGTPTVLDYFEETTHVSIYTGAFTSGSITHRVKRMGNEVRISFPQIQAARVTAAILTASTALPARFRPTTEQTFGIRGISGSTIQMITARIQTNGIITFSTITGGNFPAGTCGTAATKFAYDLDL